MEGFEWLLQLEDGVSGPAKAERDALKQLLGAVDAVGRSIAKLSGNHGLQTFAETSASSAFAGTKSVRAMTEGLDGLAVSAFEAAAALGLADLGFKATKFAVEAAEFKENATLAYAAVLGTAEEGEKAFSEIDKLAGAVHMPARRAHEMARELMLQGVEDTRTITATLAAQSALVRSGNEAGADKLRSLIERSLATGRFDVKLGGGKGAPSGRALAGLGIHLPEFLNDLSKRTGIAVQGIPNAIKAGQVPTEVGIAALVDAVNNGVVGKFAASKYDINDFTTDAVNSFTKMVQDVNLDKLEQSLFDVGYALGFVVDHKAGIQGLFQTLVDEIGMAIDSALLFGVNLENSIMRAELAVAPLIKSVQWVIDTMGKLDNWSDEVERKEEELGNKISGKIANFFGIKMPAPESEPASGGVNKQTFDASNPLSGSDEGAKRAGVDMGKSAIEGARQGADAHSPSDEMKRLGQDMSDGLGLGFSARSVSESMRTGSNGGDSGKTVNVDFGGLHFNAPVTHEEFPELVEAAIIDAWDRINLELGT